MEIKFTVPGAPKGKQRPRICRINGRNMAYTPRQTVEYEKLIKARYNAVSDAKFDKNEPLEINVIALFQIPKSASKKSKKMMINGQLLPAKKPDIDNIAKVVLEALNGICYHDDAQICQICCKKMYAENPEIQVTIKNYEEQTHENI